MVNYYDVLEVSPKASAEVIRAAYKSLMQRYHPDKNPGDQAIAERASLVVQAYEVLANTEQRARYDQQLSMALERPSLEANAGNPRKARVPARRKVVAKKENKLFWGLCLLILIIILAVWALTRRLDQSLDQRGDAGGQLSSTPPSALEKFSVSPTSSASALEIPIFITGLSIALKNPEVPGESTGRILHVPALGVRVGARDAENAMRHLQNTKEAIAQRLREKLATAKFETLNQPGGEKYLTGLMLEIIAESAGTPNPGNALESVDRYGVVAVVLPDSFSVR